MIFGPPLVVRRGHPLLRGALAGRAAPAGELAALLGQLVHLRQQGLLTHEECEAARSRLLGT